MLSSSEGCATPILKYDTLKNALETFFLSFHTVTFWATLSIYLCQDPPCSVSNQTIAMAWPCFLFLCQLFLSTGLTGSPLDNSAFLLPGWASCFHCMEFSNQELVPPVSQQALLLLYRGGTIQLSRKHPSPLLPFIRAKHTERVYVHVLMYQQNKVLITFRHGLEGHTHTHMHTGQ